MPDAGDDKDYQFWVIADGKPQDMGIINLDDQSSIALLEMKVDEGDQPIAIIVESKR